MATDKVTSPRRSGSSGGVFSPTATTPRNFTFEGRSTGSPRKHSRVMRGATEDVSSSTKGMMSPSKMKNKHLLPSSTRGSSSARQHSLGSGSANRDSRKDSRDDVDPVNRRDHEGRTSPSYSYTPRGSRSSPHASASPSGLSERLRKTVLNPSSQSGHQQQQHGEAHDREAGAVHAHTSSSRAADMERNPLGSLREPDPNLKELIDVLVDEDCSQLRRVNACGAIKTLTITKKNQIPLSRTRGVVESITAVLCRVDASEEERTRCINALMHLCVPEQNWRIVYAFPQTAEALARNMADKYPQIRYAACLALSFLAKKNRKEILANKILMHSIARVLEVEKHYGGSLERIHPQDKKVLVGSRLCALKMLLHLSKNRDVSTKFARTDCILQSLVQIASTMELAANILCIAIVTNLTRHPENAQHLVYNVPGMVPVLVHATEGADHECCKCALYALQNLACMSSCRQELANTPNLLASITKNSFKTQHPEQQLAALQTLKNLSDDPFNLVTMTNTPGCSATLLALANDPSNKMAQYLACDTLATLSHWLLTLSASKRSKNKNKRNGMDLDLGRRTFQISTWGMWS